MFCIYIRFGYQKLLQSVLLVDLPKGKGWTSFIKGGDKVTEPEERQNRQKETILRYSDMVYRLAYALVKDRYDADDIYQEVFTGWLRKNPQFQNEEHEKAWFIRATVNRCKNFWKSAWQSRTEGFGEGEWLGMAKRLGGDACRNCAGELAAGGDGGQEEALIEKVKLLPQKYRAVIHLFYYEDMSVEEIGIALKIKPSTVRTQLTRARRLLKKKLEEG